MNKLFEFFLITTTSYYLFTQYQLAYNDKKPKIVEYSEVACQTDLTNNEIDNLFKFKKDMDDIDNGTYQWNII